MLSRHASKVVAYVSPRLKRSILRLPVERVLRSTEETDTSRADQAFESLMASEPPLDDGSYGYDDLSIWRRASTRCNNLLGLPGLSDRPKKVLEAGCGDGMVGKLLATYGHQVTLTDLEDWRHDHARDLDFIASPLEKPLPIESGSIDLICSYNTLEHVDDPRQALAELSNLLAPGGCIYLHFGPLFNSPLGLHAYRMAPIPYCQFLFNEEFLLAKLKDIGIRDLGAERSELQPLNRWSTKQFESLWDTCGLETVFARRMTNYSSLSWILRYPKSFQGRGLNWNEVTTQAWEVCLRKNAS